MSIEYLCMFGLRGTMGSCPAGGRWPQKSGKARMLNPGIDMVLVAAARYSLGSWWGIQAPCLSSNLSIIVQWWNSSAPSSSSSCSSPLWTEGASSLGAQKKKRFQTARIRNQTQTASFKDREVKLIYFVMYKKTPNIRKQAKVRLMEIVRHYCRSTKQERMKTGNCVGCELNTITGL